MGEVKKGRGSEGGEDGRERRGGNARVGKATPFDREDNKPVKLRMNCSCQWGRQGEHERKGAQGIEAKGGEAKGGEAKGGEVERRRGAKGNEGEAKGRGEHMRDTGRKKGNEREGQSEREREREREGAERGVGERKVMMG